MPSSKGRSASSRQASSNKNAGRKPPKKKKRKVLRNTVLALLAVAVLLVVGWNVYLELLVNRTGVIGEGESAVDPNVTIPEETEPGYTGPVIDDPVHINERAKAVKDIDIQGDTRNITNFLLLGIETENKDNYVGRSDSIMILSLNQNKGKEGIRLVSLLRDTYVPIEGTYPQKLNAAFRFGKHELLLDTIEQQFRLKIDKVIAVNFQAFELAINKMDGVDIELTADEAKLIGVAQTAGTYHLDGHHALEYSRIRAIGNDWNRARRQRVVIKALMTQAKTKNVLTLNSVLFDVLPKVHTNMEGHQLKGYVSNVFTYLNYPVTEVYFPELGTFEDPYIKGVGRAMVMNDPAQTVRDLHHFLYD